MNAKDPYADPLPPDDLDAQILASSDWVYAARSFEGDPWIVDHEPQERAGDWVAEEDERAYKAMLRNRVEIELAYAETHGDPDIRARVAAKREAAPAVNRSGAESWTDQYWANMFQRRNGAGWR